MRDILLDPGVWVALFSVTLVQIALGADNLIIITILANKLPPDRRQSAIRWGLILAMLFRILFLAVISYLLRYAIEVFYSMDLRFGSWLHLSAESTGKSVILIAGGLFLVEILGLFVLLLIGFVLFLEGGHAAHLTVNGSEFPYIPQWIVIFILVLMFSVDLYQNWLERKTEQEPVVLHRRKR